MNKPIDWTKPVRTTDGLKVTILSFAGPHSIYPIVGYIEGEKITRNWSYEGQNSLFFPNVNLENISEEKEGWIIIYNNKASMNRNTVSSIFASKEEAKEVALRCHLNKIIDIIKIQWKE